MERLLAVLAVSAVAACAPVVMQMYLAPADVERASALLAAGTGTVGGSALMRQRGGGVVTCAGNEVFLVPATESASAEVRRLFGGDQGYVRRGGTELSGGTLVVPPDPNRTTTCNAQGFFTFPNVRSGKWYVMTTIVWMVGSEYQGGTLLGSTVLGEGQEAEVVLSQ
jgi:hypothetical protein